MWTLGHEMRADLLPGQKFSTPDDKPMKAATQ
jgi:hypothetical protein